MLLFFKLLNRDPRSVMTHLKRLVNVRHYESWVAVLVHDVIDMTLGVVIDSLVWFIHDVFDHLASSVVYADLWKIDKFVFILEL